MAFIGRYRAGKFASLGWEFHFGMWLGSAPVVAIGLALEFGGDRWLALLFGVGFVINAVRYVKYFYLDSKARPWA